jgi:hypothetical protein
MGVYKVVVANVSLIIALYISSFHYLIALANFLKYLNLTKSREKFRFVTFVLI